MTFDFHKNRQTYFEHQTTNCREFLLPFVSEEGSLPNNARVLEIGCAEGGVLKAFADIGCRCTGVERNSQRLALASEFMKSEIESGRVEFLDGDIYDIIEEGKLANAFDLIVLKDVIEHIHDQSRLLTALKELLGPRGRIFFGFPPWCMPFGGHQQMCKSKVLSKLPYFHLLPRFAYKKTLEIFGETEIKVRNLLEIQETRLPTAQFEKILRETGYRICSEKFYFINPIYRYKFGLKPRTQLRAVSAVPHLRDFLTTAAYYLVEPKGA